MNRDEEMVTDPTTGGKKASKLAKFSLLPWDALWLLAEHYGRGAEKYEPDNWKRVTDLSLFEDAMGRHLALYQSGETHDPETGSHHLICVAWHALTLVWHQELKEQDAERDDIRPAPLPMECNERLPGHEHGECAFSCDRPAEHDGPHSSLMGFW